MSTDEYHTADDLTDEQWQEWGQELKDTYRFYVLNPAHTPGVSYSLWVQEGGREHPIMQSNTGGFTTFNSKDTDVGDGIEPTDEFLRLVGCGFHEAMAFMPHLYMEQQFSESVEMWYDGKPREYEVWAAANLIQQFTMGERLFPELEPLAKFADRHSEFDLPVLHNE